ncbi:MAG: NACHT domain-containing protein, partial [Chloroflexi bacterium]|nr:NACHT domain-containing protein [Chloroflexota bacterium]
ELLKDIDDPAVVLLGAPGSGKTTLLRRLQLDEAGDRLADGGPSVSFFISLNRYALGAPEPDEWLAGEWNTTHPDLPPFDDLRRAGRLLLLLDALNEMPHRDDDDLAARIDHWRDFLRPFTECGNRIVFTCRSLDYSMPLSSPEVTVRQATLKPMTPGQIHEFLQVYVPDQAESV